MKIEKVIFCIDDNPHYKGFWSSISKHYKQRLGVTPKLFVICNLSNPPSYDTSFGEVEYVPLIENIPTIIQALIGKFYFTKTEPDTIWKIGDLDLYPLQTPHFVNALSEIDNDKYVHLNPHGYGVNWRSGFRGLPGYFHVAKGKVFEEELKFQNKTFENVCGEIYNSDRWGIKFYNLPASSESKLATVDWGWFCCEEMYTGELLKLSEKLVEIAPPNYTRLDRSNMSYNLNDVSNGQYIDFHSPRPYENHQEEIEKILSFFPHSI